MIHKNRNNRRFFRKRAIAKKNRIWKMYNEDPYYAPLGKLAKGKLHCSCNLCSAKSTKLRNCGDKGFTSYNSETWYPVRDRKRMCRACESYTCIADE